MYSVFIVDDEIIVREGLRNKLDWEANGFTFAGEAEDGEIALSMIQDIKPDILITDIRMPFMDGLELSKCAKKIQPWLRIIILSGHDEFDYAKRAISIGVEDYILKPFTLEEVTASLEKVARSLDMARSNLLDLPRAKEKLESVASLARASLLADVVYGTEKAETFSTLALEHGVLFDSAFYACTISELHSEGENKDALLTAQTAALTLETHEANCMVFMLSSASFAAIIKGSKHESAEERSFAFANMVQHELSANGVTVVTAIGTVVPNKEELPESFSAARGILKESRFTGTNRILSQGDLKHGSDGSIVLQENDPLVDRLQYADESEIDQIVCEYINLLGENRAHFSVIASYLLVDVIMAVSKVIECAGGDVKEVMPEILSHSFVDRAVESEDVFIREVRVVLKKLIAYRNEHMQGSADVILCAKRYIEQNAASPDICLKSVAEAVALSPNHFSTVFRQDCGVTFIEYLTHVRIDRAKKLLATTDKKSADIAYEVGFNDPHYFSFIFKKTEGVSPREYRAAR